MMKQDCMVVPSYYIKCKCSSVVYESFPPNPFLQEIYHLPHLVICDLEMCPIWWPGPNATSRCDSMHQTHTNGGHAHKTQVNRCCYPM
ncbi:hypothetical protein RchiOBHm_Chr1g0341881 [Rosa chinensis]|uniref:Uncharacterized protein n=1 Tax=Rosa chinensis TaxID=74649 RepID=A0A2P6SDV4_ROSCH|nr:hypothetical protein RchiOBHm_Chr1g0341881 [Rosa chinensis]